MKTNFTSTLEITSISALCISTATRTPVTVNVEIPYRVKPSDLEKVCRKALANRSDLAFAMVTASDVENALCALPISVFCNHAAKLERRGENGRTREPVITRTLETSVCDVLCIHKDTRNPVTVHVALADAVSIKEAEKPCRKALANRSDLAFAMVTAVNVESAVYEMKVLEFLRLCRIFGTVTPCDAPASSENG